VSGASDAEDQLFLETTRRMAPQRLADEDVRVALGLLGPGLRGPLADLGCGYGRHLEALLRQPAGQGAGPLIGIDRSRLLLAEARRRAPAARLLRGDLLALPLAAGALAGALCFYSSFALGTQEEARRALSEAARALRPGGRLVITTDNPLRLAASPQAELREELLGLGLVVEQSRFDAQAGVDEVRRSLLRPGGEKLSATWRIRYYLPDELAELARSAGLTLLRLEPDARLTAHTPQLVALLQRSGAPGQ
jgi:SAM-dependent methyltransferase